MSTTQQIDALLLHHDWLCALARQLCGDPQRAADAVQETFSRALVQRSDAALRRPRPWLAQVLRNVVRMDRRTEARRRAREAARARSVDAVTSADVAERVAAQRELAGLVLQLPEPLRETILLKYYEGLPEREIAVRTGVATSTVSTRAARALEELRRRLGARHGEGRWPASLALLLARRSKGAPRPEPLASAAPGAALVVTAVTAIGLAAVWLVARGRPDAADPAPGSASGVDGGVTGVSVASTAMAGEASPSRRALVAAAPVVPAGVQDPDPAETRWLQTLEQARTVAAAAGESVWPGYDFRELPIAIFERGGRALLVQHPSPPDGYSPLPARRGVELQAHRGPTGVQMNANTAGRLGGAVCAFVGARSLATDGPRARDVALVLHESGHAFQHGAPAGGAMRWPTENAQLVASYPVNAPDNNAWARLEAVALAQALEAGADTAMREHGRAFCKLRAHRQAQLDPALAQFERHAEQNEGLAEYVALRAISRVAVAEARRLGLVDPSAYGPAGTAMRDLVESLRRANVAGAGAARRRFYWTGAAQAFLLDRLHPEWKAQLRPGGPALQDLLAAALGLGAETLESDAAAVAAARDLARVLAEEQSAAASAGGLRRARLAAVTDGPGRTLVVDLSAAGGAADVRSFDPMNLVAIDDALRLHSRMVELGFRGGQVALRQPAIQDLDRELVVTRLPGDAVLEIGRGASRVAVSLDEASAAPTAGVELALRGDGVTLRASHGSAVWADDLLVIRPSRPEDARVALDAARQRLQQLTELAHQPIPAPTIDCRDLAGGPVRLPGPPGVERAVVFVSAAAWAVPSHDFARELLRVRRPGDQLLLVLSQCSATEAEELLADTEDRRGIIHDPERAIMRRFGVARVPSVVWIDPQGVMARPVVGASSLASTLARLR
ncbi:MAG: sigma-70 family RNA polymerase sigma factor [Planctomycetota bacterium]